MVIKNFTIFIILNFISIQLVSQEVYLDELNLMNDQRNIQITDTINNIDASFLIRSTLNYQFLQTGFKNKKRKNVYQKIYFGYDHVNNSLLPQNWNDGNMYPARGWQERFTVGLQLKFGILDINIQPEWLKVQNIPQQYYPGNPEDGNFMPKYFGSVANVVDNFRQFGTNKIDTMTLGQTRVGLVLGPVSIGYSNQNIWWGPGKRSSIVFTNNAAGFKHFYVSTNRPIKSPIGNFEFSAISGILDTNWYQDPDIPLMRSIWSGGIAMKNLDQRQIDAITLNLSPNWLPNLFLGYAYSRQFYQHKLNPFGFPYSFFSNDREKMEIGSLLFRFILPKDNAEFYGELGIQNSAAWPWKFFNQKATKGYIFGVTKIVNLYKNKIFLNCNLELSQLQLMDPRNVFYPNNPFVGGQINSWYTDFNIKQGYSNNGQIMGASIGPGSNIQTLNMTFQKGLNKIGFQIERIVNNNDFFYVVYYSPNSYYGYYNKYWVDINKKIFIQINPLKSIIVAASFMNTESLNYRWIKNPDPGKKYDEPSSQTDKFNVQFQLSLKYLLHAKIQ